MEPIRAVTKGIVEGWAAEAAELDGFGEVAIDAHLTSMMGKAGRVDISFNAVCLRNTRLQAWL